LRGNSKLTARALSLWERAFARVRVPSIDEDYVVNGMYFL
jgi:hypothetical protein